MSIFSDPDAVWGTAAPAALDHLLGAAPHASTDPMDRERASTDRSGFVADTHPDGVVFAESAEDVVATLQLATEHRVPVVPRGAGTGLAGGSSARSGEVVLDVSRMNKILRQRGVPENSEMILFFRSSAVCLAFSLFASSQRKRAINVKGG